MNGHKAKLIRKFTLGDLALKSQQVRMQSFVQHSVDRMTVVNVGKRKTYQNLKKAYKRMPWFYREVFIQDE